MADLGVSPRLLVSELHIFRVCVFETVPLCLDCVGVPALDGGGDQADGALRSILTHGL